MRRNLDQDYSGFRLFGWLICGNILIPAVGQPISQAVSRVA
jgi:hypothetical protein